MLATVIALSLASRFVVSGISGLSPKPFSEFVRYFSTGVAAAALGLLAFPAWDRSWAVGSLAAAGGGTTLDVLVAWWHGLAEEVTAQRYRRPR